MMSHLIQCPGSHGDVITVICVMKHRGLDCAGSLLRGVTDKHPLFQLSVSQSLFDLDLLYKRFDHLCDYPFSHVIRCWCGTIATSFPQVAQRDSHDLLPFFPRGCTFSVATTNACCPCHLVRVTSTLAVGRVVTFARRWLLMLLRCSTTHCDFPPNADDLFSVRACCLANVLPAPRFPSSRPDTASFRSCLLLPPGFLDSREGGICARSRALSSFIFPPFGLVVAFALWPQAACE